MAKQRPVLVTGFEPFGGQETNASWEAVSLLPPTIAGHPVERRLLPVTFGASGDVIVGLMSELSPACVVAVGEAGGRAALTIERAALNVMEAHVADNAGAEPHGEPVVEGGPASYLSTMPLEACAEAARRARVPASVSNTAGLYVCNQVMYRILHKLAIENAYMPAGFVHVPYQPVQCLENPQVASMEAATAARGIEAVIAACLC